MKSLSTKIKKFTARTPALLIGLAILASVAGFTGVRLLNTKHVDASSCPNICVALTKEGMNPDTLAVKVGDFVQFNTADGKMHNISLGAGDDGHEAHSATSRDDGHAANSTSHEHDDQEANNATHEHTGSYSSGDFGAGEAWKVQFKTPGTFFLHDHYNPKSQILIVVYQPGQISTIK